MTLHWPEITGTERFRPIRTWRPGYSLADQHFVGTFGISAQGRNELVLVRKAGPFAPLCTQCPPRSYRRPFIIRDDRKKILDSDCPRSSEILNRRLVNRNELGADCRRSDDARMHHVR